jgi:orotidine-5'-phosphate decarboxylase
LFKNFKGQIIWSADGVFLEYILKMIDSGKFPKDVAIKLDRLFLTIYGLQSITEIQNRGVPVFADAKIVEIPSKSLELTKLHLQYQPWMLNAMADICNTGVTPSSDSNPENYNPDVLNDFAGLCKDAGTLSCAVTVLTSKTDELVKKEFGKSALDAVLFLSELAIDCGITDIVCSPIEAKSVRALSSLTGINTPGVRLPESSADDQARIMTPAKALENGATRLVIGRDLSRDGMFAENYLKIMANIEGKVF